jgi:hypothetical protein
MTAMSAQSASNAANPFPEIDLPAIREGFGMHAKF